MVKEDVVLLVLFLKQAFNVPQQLGARPILRGSSSLSMIS